MIYTKDNLNKQTKKKAVKIIVECEYIGDKPMSEIMLPIIFDELMKQFEQEKK